MISPFSNTLRGWRHWTVQLALIAIALGALYYWVIGPAYEDYQMQSGRWEKTFPAASGQQPKDTDFTVRGCRNITGRPDPDGLKAIDWQVDGVAVVKYVVSEHCAAPFAHGGYSVAGDTLTLEYRIDWRTSTRAACICAYDLEYRIRNLPRKNYIAHVRNLGAK